MPPAQLTQVTLPGSQTITYVYNAAGDRTEVINNGTTTSYSSNADNEITQVGVDGHLRLSAPASQPKDWLWASCGSPREGTSSPGARGIVPRRFGALVPIPERRSRPASQRGERGQALTPGLGSGLGPWIGARVAPQQSPILRPGQWRLSLRLGSAPIAR